MFSMINSIKKKEYKVNLDCLFLILLYILSVFSIGNSWKVFKYSDEFFAVVMGLNLLWALLLKKLNKFDLKLFYRLLIVVGLGIISSFRTDISRNLSSVILDIFSFLKIFLVYFGTRVLFNKNPKTMESFLQIMSKLIKLFFIVSFVFCILNFVGVVKMYNSMRFGIKSFHFIFDNPSQFGVIIGASLAILIYSKNYKWIDVALGIIVLLSTVKGMSIIVAVTFLSLFLLGENIRGWKLLLVGVILLVALSYQIQTYMLEMTAPRAMLLRYGFITANNYFPLGSGFATYGSDMAGRYYSPLYYKYGFHLRKSLQYNQNTAINDVYLGMIVGQFGYIALLFFALIIYSLGSRIIKSNMDKNSRNICLACFACMCGMMVMAGSVKGVPGELLMLVIALLFSMEDMLPNKKADKEQEIQSSTNNEEFIMINMLETVERK